MRIWVLTYGNASWDEQAEVMVIAETEHDARSKASDICGDEGPDRWFNPTEVTAVSIGTADPDTDPDTTVRDFVEG